MKLRNTIKDNTFNLKNNLPRYFLPIVVVVVACVVVGPFVVDAEVGVVDVED